MKKWRLTQILAPVLGVIAKVVETLVLVLGFYIIFVRGDAYPVWSFLIAIGWFVAVDTVTLLEFRS
jgi:hypothetical protein